jgi:hypothetical protein
MLARLVVNSMPLTFIPIKKRIITPIVLLLVVIQTFA